MAKLSISKAWNETAEFVAREARYLVLIAFAFISLPVAMLQVISPRPASDGSVPGGLWLLAMPLVMALILIGSVALSYLALRSGVSIGEALRRGVRRLLPLIGAAIVVSIPVFLLFLVVSMIAMMLVPGALDAAMAGTPGPELERATQIALLVMLPVSLFISARLAVLTPAAAAEDIGVFGLIGRSWRLTGGHTLKLMLFMLLVTILAGLLNAAVAFGIGSIVMLLLGPIHPGSTSAFVMLVVSALLMMLISIYLVPLMARIYAQLAGGEGTGAAAA